MCGEGYTSYNIALGCENKHTQAKDHYYTEHSKAKLNKAANTAEQSKLNLDGF